jgi:hypothetical protein
MGIHFSPKITTENLQIHMDWSATRCYSGSGSTFNNLVSGKTSIGYIKNNVTFSTTNGGILTTNGANSGAQYNVGDRIDINTSAANVDRFNGTDNFSIFFWVNQTASSGRIFSTGSAGSGTGNSDNCIWQMWVSTGTYYWWNSSGGGTNNLTVSGTWHTPGTWQYIGFTYTYNDGGNNTVRCYANDTLMMTGQTATATHSYINRASASSLQWTLGGGYSSGCFNTNSACKFGTFSVYNKALTATEVTQNFNATRARFGV